MARDKNKSKYEGAAMVSAVSADDMLDAEDEIATAPTAPVVVAVPEEPARPAVAVLIDPPTLTDAPAPGATTVTAAPVQAKPRTYRVKVSKVMSLSGHMTQLSKGDIVSESSYGPIGMARILESGVELEELP